MKIVNLWIDQVIDRKARMWQDRGRLYKAECPRWLVEQSRFAKCSRLFATNQKGRVMVAEQLSALFSQDGAASRSLAQRIADLNRTLAELPQTDRIELGAELQSATNELVRLFEEWVEVRRERVALFGG